MEKLWNFLEPLFPIVNSYTHGFFSNSCMTIKWSFSARERKAYVKIKYRPLREKWELCWNLDQSPLSDHSRWRGAWWIRCAETQFLLEKIISSDRIKGTNY